MKELTGALFRNHKKATDKQPDYRGDALIGGVKHKIAAWLKKTGDGEPYMFCKYTPTEPPAQTSKVQAAINEDIPF